jgi:hypothetical protein
MNADVAKFLEAAKNPQALARAFSMNLLVLYAHVIISAILIKQAESNKKPENKKDE